MTAAASINAANTQFMNTPHKRGCLFYIVRGLLGFAVLLIALLVLGFIYQTVAAENNKRQYPPRGQFYTVNGHQMHLYCAGKGSPTVVLEAGCYGNSLWWYRIQGELA
jgi:hypothetical protein